MHICALYDVAMLERLMVVRRVLFMQMLKRCGFSYSQVVFTMEFLISYSLNVLPSFQLQRLGLIISLGLFFMHSWISIRRNRQSTVRDQI